MKPNTQFEWINILRGISCLAIILYHVRIDLWVGWREISSNPDLYSPFDHLAALLSIPAPFFRPVVMMFFLISGFCIHFPYVTGTRTFEFRHFFSRRLLRIYPPYLAAILLSLWVQASNAGGVEAALTDPTVIPRALKSVLLIQNWGENSGQITTNPSLWFIPVQIELYLVYPLFLWAIRKYSLKSAVVGVAAISFSSLGWQILAYDDRPGRHLGNVDHFPVFWIIWCTGALLAELVQRDRLPQWRPYLWGVTSLLFVVAMGTTLTQQYIGLQEMVWSGVYLLIIWWGLCHSSRLTSIPSSVLKAPLFVSTLSYSLYLIHFPLFKWIGAYWLNVFGTKPTNFFIPLGFCGVAILVACAFYQLVERPTQYATSWVSSRMMRTS